MDGQGRTGQSKARQGRAEQADLHDVDLGGRLATPDLDSKRDGDAFSNPCHKPAQLSRLAQQRSSQTTPCRF